MRGAKPEGLQRIQITGGRVGRPGQPGMKDDPAALQLALQEMHISQVMGDRRMVDATCAQPFEQLPRLVQFPCCDAQPGPPKIPFVAVEAKCFRAIEVRPGTVVAARRDGGLARIRQQCRVLGVLQKVLFKPLQPRQGFRGGGRCRHGFAHGQKLTSRSP